jgi:hypothetical protein
MIFRGLQRKADSRKKESLSILEVFEGTIRRQRQALLLFLVLLTTATKARSQTAQDSPQDQTANQDCSDPMMAGTAGCAQSSQLPILPKQQRYPNIATQPNTQPGGSYCARAPTPQRRTGLSRSSLFQDLHRMFVSLLEKFWLFLQGSTDTRARADHGSSEHGRQRCQSPKRLTSSSSCQPPISYAGADRACLRTVCQRRTAVTISQTRK